MAIAFGIFLVIVWVVLLMTYPGRALIVSLCAVLLLGLVVAWVIYQDSRDRGRLTRIELSMSYDLEFCTLEQPLRTILVNRADHPLLHLSWQVTAFRSGDTVNLVEGRSITQEFDYPEGIPPGGTWQICLPLPAIRSGYRPETLEFGYSRQQGHFGR